MTDYKSPPGYSAVIVKAEPLGCYDSRLGPVGSDDLLKVGTTVGIPCYAEVPDGLSPAGRALFLALQAWGQGDASKLGALCTKRVRFTEEGEAIEEDIG